MSLETGTKPQLNWRTTHHSAQRDLLERSLRRDRLAHAYVFAGPAEADAAGFARDLARLVLCQDKLGCDECGNCRTLAAGSNADYLELSGTDSLKVESVRDLAYKLALKPYAATHKVAVIVDAHGMTTEAANALLKVLEEPKPNTVLILVTDNAHKLLPTISSRTQKIHFAPVLDSVRAPDDDDLLARLQSLAGQPLGERLAMAAELAERESPQIRYALGIMLRQSQSGLRESPTPAQAARVRAVVRAQRLLDQNVSSKLLLSELMVNSN